MKRRGLGDPQEGVARTDGRGGTLISEAKKRAGGMCNRRVLKSGAQEKKGFKRNRRGRVPECSMGLPGRK